MTTYGDVRTKFISRMNRRDMTVTDADGFLQDTITRIQRILRVPAMEAAVNFTIDGTYDANGGLFIPSDYLQLRQMTYNDKIELRKEDVSLVVPFAANNVGESYLFCRRGGLWVLAPKPEAGAIVRVDYYAEFPSMTQITDRTPLTDLASDLMIFGALSYACDHWSDKRGDKFEARFTQILSDIEGMGDDDETSGSAAVQPAYGFNDDLEGTA